MAQTMAIGIINQRLRTPSLAEDAGDQQRGLAGQHHADQDRGLGERQRAGDQIQPAADGVADVLDDAFEHLSIVA